jgi:hypothetical protein
MNSIINWMAKLRWERRRPRLFARLRVAGGVWLLILAALLFGFDRGGWWLAALLLLAAAADFYCAYRLPRAIEAGRRTKDAR